MGTNSVPLKLAMRKTLVNRNMVTFLVSQMQTVLTRRYNSYVSSVVLEKK